MVTLKLSESIEPSPLSFCAVASNLAVDSWSASRNIISQFLLTVGRFLCLLTSRVIGQGSTTNRSPPRLDILCKFVSVLERIVSTNSPTQFIEARKEGRAIYPALLQVYNQNRQNSHWEIGLFTHIPFYRNVRHFPPENQKEPCRRYGTPLYTSKQAMLSVHIAVLVYRKSILNWTIFNRTKAIENYVQHCKQTKKYN